MSGNSIPFFELLLHSNRQLRILFFDDQNKLKPEAAYYFRWLQHFCHAERPVYKQNPITGAIDSNATHIAAGRLEVWQEHAKRLNLNTDEVQNQLNILKQEETWRIKQTQAA